MATTVVDVGVNVTVNWSGSSQITFDDVSESPTNCGTGIGSMPTINDSIGHDTTTTTNIDFVAHGDNTIGAGATVTLDFTVILADDKAVVGTQAKIKHALFSIIDPDDTVKLRMARNAADVVPFGINPVTTGYTEFFRQFLFREPVNGSVGDKIVVINPSATTVHFGWAIAGDSTTRT